MKRGLYIILPIAGLLVCLCLLKQKQATPVEVGTEARAVKLSVNRASQNTSQDLSERPPIPPDTVENNETWVKDRSAGLEIPPKPDPAPDDYHGQDIILYRYQLHTSERSIMLGEGHERRNYRIYVNSPSVNSYPLSVVYPRWAEFGIETTGGFVFMRDENPVTKIGVILPKVRTPEDMGPDAADLLEWQILIAARNGPSDVDARTKAKPQSLGSDVVVLMPTHPDKIPANSLVVWFKFERDGTVSLQED